MKNIKITTVCILLVVIMLVLPVRGEPASWSEAISVANNWIARVVETQGHWGGYDWAEVEHIQEFTRNDRVIGYFFSVKPVGFIVVSLRKELAPVKAYSDTSNLDPESDEGMADLLKMKMEAILDSIEGQLGSIKAAGSQDVQGTLEIDYRPAWDVLCGEVRTLSGEYETYESIDSVTQVGPLLSSSWHQGEPYNILCPEGDTTCTDCCPEDGDPDSYCPASSQTVVGCVATAAAQIMKYWNWPPHGIGSHSYYWNGDDSCPSGGTTGAGERTLFADFSDDYNWLKMPDRLTNDSSQDEINDVAALCYEIGVAQEMDYGVCKSLSGINNSCVINYRYSSVLDIEWRCDPNRIPNCYGQEKWFSDIKDQLNLNRPIQYIIPDHSIVVDGWLDDIFGKKYHINYGWHDENKTMWYNLDEIYDGKPNEEGMLVNFYPAQALGDDLIDDWTYYKEQFNYLYFDEDTQGQNVTFAAGQNLQFLPGVKVECIGGNIEFHGESSNETRLFSIRGMSQAEIKIRDGGLKLHAGGGIKFYE